MTATYNPAEVERLIAEAREDDARMTKAPWSVDSKTGIMYGDCRSDEGAIDIAIAVRKEAARDPEGIARTRNNLAALADQLDAAQAEIASLSKRPLRTFDQIAADRLADEVAVLVRRRVIDARSPAGDALLDYRDPPPTERSDRLAALEAELTRLRAEVSTLRTANHLAEELAGARTSVIARRRAAQDEAERLLGMPPRAGGYSTAEVVEAIRAVVAERDRLAVAAEAAPVEIDRLRHTLDNIRVYAEVCDAFGAETGGNPSYLAVAKELRRLLDV